MTPNELEDIQREMFSSYLCEEISGRVALGIYPHDGCLEYDDELVTVQDLDNEPWFPLVLKGKATACYGDYEDEGINFDVHWEARFVKKNDNNSLTYKVQRKDDHGTKRAFARQRH